MESTIIQQLKKIPTPSVSDALDYFGINGSIQNIYPLKNTMRTVGFAFTVKYTTEGASGTPTANYPEQLSCDDVAVIDNEGRTDCTVWGEMLTLGALQAKANGVIINGCCRDVSEIVSLNFPTFSKSTFMRTGKSRVKLEYIQKPIIINSITIEPRDIICGDCNGIVVIPRNKAALVVKLAAAIDNNDQLICSAIKNGMSLAQAKQTYHYDKFAEKFMESGQ